MKKIFVLLLVLVLALFVVSAVAAEQGQACEALLGALNNIPPDSAAYQRTLALAEMFCGGSTVQGATLRSVQERGVLTCGVNATFPGFGYYDSATDTYSGFDWDYCRALAAAVLGDADAVAGMALTAVSRFAALQSGEVDVLIRNTSRTLSRDSRLELDFAPTTFYDGQSFMVRSDSGIHSVPDLADHSVCVRAGTTTEFNLHLINDELGLNLTIVSITEDNILAPYLDGACDALSSDRSILAFLRRELPDPGAHEILSEIISKEPLGPVVRHGDDNWQDIVTWTVFCTLAAEQYGITSANAEALLNSDISPIRLILGVTGGLGTGLGLSDDFCYQVIVQVGNYAEIYNRNLGTGSTIGLPRGLNSQWLDGGLLYSPPFR
jgi:general L-amino acid transport system substrate-binding protein